MENIVNETNRQVDENRILVSKKVLAGLYYHAVVDNDLESLIADSHQLLLSLTPLQREEIVRQLIRGIEAHADIRFMDFIPVLKDSIHNPGPYFTTVGP